MRFNPTPLTDQQRELARTHYALALTIAQRFIRRLRDHQWADEFQSEAGMALIRAARNYQPDRGIPFSHLAFIAVRNACKALFYQLQPQGFRHCYKARQHEVPTITHMTTESERLIAAPETNQRNPSDFTNLIRHATHTQQHDLVCHYIHGESFRQIAARRGVSHQCVAGSIKTALRRIARRLAA